jgi:hypothetical protein
MSVVMQAPSGVGAVTIAASGTTYTPNSAGQINAQNSDVPALLALNYSAVSGPAQFLANFRNLIDGGDFTTNPFQRNIPGLASGGVISTAITSTPTYFSDRFFAVGGASSSILMAAVADTSVQGFSQSLKISRSSGNANAAAINVGQVLETADSIRAQGQQVTLSFYAKQGANYSGGALSVAVISGTGTNQSAASMVAATWTGQASSVSGSQSLSTSMTRYSFTGNIPANATQLGVLLTWTPSGTAGSDDSITINGVQLEIGSMSAFEHRDAQVELELGQRYAYVLAEPATGVICGIGGATQAANNQIFYKPLPTPMLKAPTVTIAAGSFKVAAGAAAAAATGFAAGATHTQNEISLVSTLTQTAGGAASLQGGGGSGYIIASSDF